MNKAEGDAQGMPAQAEPNPDLVTDGINSHLTAEDDLPDAAPTRAPAPATINYDDLDRQQLIRLLRRHDSTRKVGLVWERSRQAEDLSEDFVVLDHIGSLGQPSENLLIQGENHDALRHLRMTHKGKVKLAYLDPPYNTKSAFTAYDDNFEHSVWLSAMQVRMELVYDLLRPDGVLWVSIDDREAHYLKVLLDEIFDRSNFITSFVWQKVDSPSENKSPISADHEYILVYAVDRELALAGMSKLPAPEILKAYPMVSDDDRRCRDRLLKKNGKDSLRADRESMYFGIPGPDGVDVFPIHDDGREARWAKGAKVVNDLLKADKIIWKIRFIAGMDRWVPYVREYAPDVPARPNPTILLDCDTSRQAKAHIKELLPGVTPFDTVKPEKLLLRILEIATKPGDLVFDAYLGSGTTASVAHKIGRRWIGIEREADVFDTFCVPRLQAVIAGEQGGISEDLAWDGGGGCTILRTRSMPYEDVAYDLDAKTAWTTIKLLHGVPLSITTDNDADQKPFQSAELSDGGIVCLIDNLTPEAVFELGEYIESGRQTIVWAWSPGLVLNAFQSSPGLTVHRLPDDLTRRFG